MGLSGFSPAALRRWFGEPVLARAANCRVGAIEVSTQGALQRVTARVEGHRPYAVELLLQPGVSPRSQCECAYASLGRACKHQAALALAWRAGQVGAAEEALLVIAELESERRPREALAAAEAAQRAHPDHAGIEAHLLAAYERDGWDEQALRLRRAAFERQPGRERYLALQRAAEAAGQRLDALALWAWLDAAQGAEATARQLQAWAEQRLAQARPPFDYEQALVRGALARMAPPQARLWWAWLKLQAKNRPALRQALDQTAQGILEA